MRSFLEIFSLRSKQKRKSVVNDDEEDYLSRSVSVSVSVSELLPSNLKLGEFCFPPPSPFSMLLASLLQCFLPSLRSDTTGQALFFGPETDSLSLFLLRAAKFPRSPFLGEFKRRRRMLLQTRPFTFFHDSSRRLLLSSACFWRPVMCLLSGPRIPRTSVSIFGSIGPSVRGEAQNSFSRP